MFGNMGFWDEAQYSLADAHQRAPPKRWYHLPDYTASHPKDLKPCGANICLKSRQLSCS